MTFRANGTAKWVGLLVVIVTGVVSYAIGFERKVTTNTNNIGHLQKQLDRIEEKVDKLLEK